MHSHALTDSLYRYGEGPSAISRPLGWKVKIIHEGLKSKWTKRKTNKQKGEKKKLSSQVHSSTGAVRNTRRGCILRMRRAARDLEGVALPPRIGGK